MIIKLYETYTDAEEIKKIIFLKAVKTYKIKIIEFFIKKGYDINNYDAFLASCDDINTFKFFLKNNIDIDKYKNDYTIIRKFGYLDIQKVLIDFGYDVFIYDNVGFNDGLNNDPKYADIIRKFDDTNKYNL